MAKIIILPSYDPTTYTQAVLQDTPLGFWPLTETSGTVANNLGTLGASANGVYGGACTVGTAPIATDGAASVDINGPAVNSSGSNTIPIPLLASLRLLGNITMEFWIKPETHDEPQADHVALAHSESGDSSNTNILYKASLFGPPGGTPHRLYTFHENGGGVNNSASVLFGTPIVVGQTYYCVIVRDVTTRRIDAYLDGVYVGTSSPYTNNPTNGEIGRMHIGSQRGAGTTEHTNGKLQHVALYNYKLGADRIALHHQIGRF